MTFLTELARLNVAIRSESDAFTRFGLIQQRDALLANHADAIEALVKAADKMCAINGPCDHFDHHGYCQTHFVEEDCTAKALHDALAALDAAGKGEA